jgi:O-antigen/teichoic acid export membrane protein
MSQLSSRSSYLARNTFILAIGRVSNQLVAFLLLPLYTYFLTPSEFGVVDLMATYLALLAPALTLQLEMASFRFLVDARKNENSRSVVITNIFHLLFVLIVPIAVALFILGTIFGFQYTNTILLAGLSIISLNMMLQISRGLGENKKYAIASMITGLTMAISAVWLIAFAGMRIEGMLLSIAISNFVGALYIFSTMRLHHYLKRGLGDKVLQREILGYSIPLVPNGAAWWVISVSDRTVVTIMINTMANGLYAVSSKYASIFTSLFSIFEMSWTETASIHINAPDRDKFFSDVSNAAVRIFGALGLGLIAVIPFIFPWFVNESFHDAYYYIPILVLAAFFNMIVGLYSAIYIAKRLTRQVMNTSLIAAGLNLVLTISLIPVFGLYAAAFATAIAFLTMAIFRHFDAKKYVVITYQKRVFVVLAALYILIAALYYTDNFIANLIALSIALIASLILNIKAVQVIKYRFIAGRKKSA